VLGACLDSRFSSGHDFCFRARFSEDVRRFRRGRHRQSRSADFRHYRGSQRAFRRVGSVSSWNGANTLDAIIGIATGLITLGVSVILVPRYGLAGAAWSDLAAIALSRPLIHFCLWRQYLREQLGLKEFLAFAYAPILVGLAGVGLITLARSYCPPEISLVQMIAGAILTASVLILWVVLLDFFPERDQRRKDVAKIVQTILRVLKIGKTRAMAAAEQA